MSSQFTPAQNRIAIIKTAANPDLAEKIMVQLADKIGHGRTSDSFNLPVVEAHFANSETNIILNESVRGKDVYIITTGAAPVNDNLMALFLLVDACKRSSAHSVNVVMPAYPYARSDKRDHRGPIGSSMISIQLECLGVDRLISCDIHSGQIQGFFPKSFDNLYSKNILIDKVRSIAESITCDLAVPSASGASDLSVPTSTQLEESVQMELKENKLANRFLLCSPDAGGLKRIKAWAESLGVNYCSMDKQRDYTQMNVVLRSRFIGDPNEVKGKYILIVDDIADTLGTMMSTITELKELGAAGVFIIISHGYFSGEAITRINGTDFIRGVICTDSLPQEENQKKCAKLDVVSLAPLLSEVILRIQSAFDNASMPNTFYTNSTSISKLFE